ncbi:MAG: hypothetical protein AB7S26_13935 [Sandaracinaceae bacterium]
MRSLAPMVILALSLAPGSARADAEALESVAAVHEACEQAREGGRPHLYVIDVDDGWRTAGQDHLRVEVRRNLRAFDGHVAILLTHFQSIEFEIEDAERIASLRRAAQEGARLRLGFFLGFDDPNRQACLVRNEHAVTIVRADLAFAELRQGETALARAEDDRLRAWQDDQETLAIPGEGPRGAVGDARFTNGAAAPESWQHALAAAETRGLIGRCHADGVQRGAAPDGQVVVRLNIETRTGRIRRADVALSSVSDDAEAECIAHAVGQTTTLSAAPPEWRADVVDLAVPVRVTR